MAARPTAYEGKEKYIFISYAHSDRDRVYKILSEFEKRGYRFWYDDGITPGAEWAEDIAEHLSAAYVVMAFITNASAASDNCRREITYALSKRKPFVSVLLEPTEMSAGLELQLSAHQSVIRDNFPTAEGFFRKLLSNPDVDLCKADAAEVIAPAEVKDSEAAVEAVEEAVPAADTVKTDKFYAQYRKNEEVQKKLDEEYEKIKQGDGLAAAAAPATEPADAGDNKNKAAAVSRLLKNKKLFVLLGAVLLAAVIYTLLTAPYKATWGESYKTNIYTLEIEGETLQQEDIDAFAKFRELGNLQLKKCDLSGCDLTAFDETDLYSVELDDCTGIFSYDFLGDDSIRHVSVTNCEDFSDLSVIDPENIAELSVSGSAVSDISALNRAQNLELLDISNTEVSDLSALRGNEYLRDLNISGSAVKSADAAMSCPGLKTLDASNCKLTDFSEKCISLELEELYLSNSGISDLSAFSDCATINTLILNDNKDLTDMSWLSKYSQSTLKTLDLSRTGLDSEGLSFIERCPKLETLLLDELNIDNLDFCLNLASLDKLSAQGCGLTDIKGISSCTMLEQILLGFNEITDISPLHDLSIPSSGDGSVYLDLSYNKVSDASSLPEGKYYTIILVGNDKSVAGSINEGTQVDTLCADWYDGIADAVVLKKEGLSLYLVGVPKSEQVATEDALYSNLNSLDMITADTLYNDLLIRPTNENDFNTYAMKISDMEETSKLYNKYVK